MVQLEVEVWSSWEDRGEGSRGTERTILQELLPNLPHGHGVTISNWVRHILLPEILLFIPSFSLWNEMYN